MRLLNIWKVFDVLTVDIPVWLKNLRLHKYTNVFQNVHWRQMIEMTDAEPSTNPRTGEPDAKPLMDANGR